MELAQEYDEAISLRKIRQHPRNPRKGDDEAVGESIDANGWFGAVLVHRSTGHVIAGNTRFRAMRKRKAKTVPGFWIECDDDTALRILLVDNRTSDMASYDDAELLALLVELEAEAAGLIGTGYTDADLAALLVEQEANLGVGESARDSDPVPDEQVGDLLALADVTLAEPTSHVEPGMIFELSGRHVLICCELMTGWQSWLPLLTEHIDAGEHVVFLPYPGPYVAAADYKVERTFVMVQPNPYLAAHLLDKWSAAFGVDSIVRR